MNIATDLHLHLHLQQAILPILSCCVKSISSSQLFSSSDTKCFFGIALRGFSVFICLIISSSIFEELLTPEKDFEQFFPYHYLLTLPVCF